MYSSLHCPLGALTPQLKSTLIRGPGSFQPMVSGADLPGLPVEAVMIGCVRRTPPPVSLSLGRQVAYLLSTMWTLCSQTNRTSLLMSKFWRRSSLCPCLCQKKYPQATKSCCQMGRAQATPSPLARWVDRPSLCTGRGPGCSSLGSLARLEFWSSSVFQFQTTRPGGVVMSGRRKWHLAHELPMCLLTSQNT